ncbi:hypothetical protein Isop_2790 [Isosphaera pallida ATCC 43644]|uniref:Uncharacterized protein n=2 Tax=Isosphaera pallida TaxID=128 RepID=E8R105_ISOPI|nr:hypothetical protein Isop_2790 [Isosphaera pallida ATCC 43644]
MRLKINAPQCVGGSWVSRHWVSIASLGILLGSGVLGSPTSRAEEPLGPIPAPRIGDGRDDDQPIPCFELNVGKNGRSALALNPSCDPHRLVETAIRDARGWARAGQPGEAFRLLRLTRELMRELVIDEATRRRVQTRLQEAFREVAAQGEEREACRRRAEAVLADDPGRLNVEALDHNQRLRREFDEILAQVGPAGGGGGGGGGLGGGGFVGGGVGVGFGFPGGVVPGGLSVAPIGVGPVLPVVAVATADRRYVRLSVSPLFLSNLSFQQYQIFQFNP